MKEKIYLVITEYNLDGEITFEAKPCSSIEVASKVFDSQCHYARSLAIFSGDNIDDTTEDGDSQCFYINRLSDDYYADIHILESEIISN